METLAIIGLIGNVVQFIDFSGKLIAKSTELYQSIEGALAENIDAETATNHLVLLNNKIKDAATTTTTSDDALKRLCESCKSTADELLTALEKVKVSGKKERRKSIRKALRSVWSKEKIREVEGRLARFREELNLHVTVDLREQVLRLEVDHTDRLKDLNSTTQGVLDAIANQQDVFKAVHDTQITLMGTLHSKTVLRVKNEHAATRREIIGEMALSIQAEHAITRKIIQEIRQHEQEPCPAVPRKSCWSVPLPRNHHFVGRSSQLHELEASLFGEKHCSKVAVIGLRGVGKTQIVLELAYRTREKRPECSVFWISTTSTENVQQAYLGIAQQLRIPQSEDKKEDVSKLVQHYLSQENAGQWLLVLDNADDLDMWLEKSDSSTKSTRLINSLPRSNKGSIVFTSRSRKAASKFAHRNVIHVTEMDEEAATLVLRNSLVNREVLNDGPTVVQLLRLLTFLPLAIVQAAAYIHENDMSLTEYVSLFDDREENIIEVLSEDFKDEGRYRDLKNPIATTWLISFEKIRVRDSLAVDYLSFMSCIDPKAVPLSLLPPAQIKKNAIDVIGTLSAYSFITKRPADQSFDLHRLVHLTTRNWLRQNDTLAKWTEKAVARLASVFPDAGYGNRSLWRAYFPHARYVLASNPPEGIKDRLLEKFGLCLLHDGRYIEAEETFLQLIGTRKRVLGQEHPSTLASIGNLASTFWGQGRCKEAEELIVQVMEIQKRVLGQEHPSILTNMANAALTFKNQGRLQEAEKLNVQAVETFKRVLGREDPSTLTCMSFLAETYSYQGQWKEAQELEMQVVEMRKKVLEQEHPDTLTSMANLASTYGNQGRWKEAEELEVQVVEMRKKVLGQEHSDTLTSMANLASMYRNKGRWKEAEKLEVEVIETQKRVLEREHPDTLTSMANLTSMYSNQERWKEAEELFVQVIEA
ncbi:TPR-like protein [Zopfia rhizophila CBS 207.26]|uniref:TPR-like protein n=1 Tax=Zopfia rhizophila CBS 207.26 TaxID=1314779 RepID=A0A6A6E0B1_9PEZI|nr:TPR-like protein [Zopfia rhizophila CBS 207.26]